MSDPRFIDIGHPAVLVIEECSELIKALCKAQRFGWMNYHPSQPERTNRMAVEEEMLDVEVAITRLRDFLNRGSDA